VKQGFWICENCGCSMPYEQEVWCWECGKGEMLYTEMPGVVCLMKEESA